MVNYLILGGIYTVFPVSITNVFGLELGPTIYVQVLFGSCLTAFLNLFTTKWLLPATNFVTLFYVGALAQIATLVLVWWFKEELDVQNLSKHRAIRMKIKTKP